MKIFVAGGTGLLGFHAVMDALRKGHEVSALAVPDVRLDGWFPREVTVHYGDLFSMSGDDILAVLRGFDSLIYAVGPDDRVVPRAPAYDFFHTRLVEGCGRFLSLARQAGVRAVSVCGSYFASFDHLWPQARLAERHPYIRCRVEQAERCLADGGDSMSVAVLELPYIFGTIPDRVPLWKDALFERLKALDPIIYTDGGSAMITAEHVGQALVGAVERRVRGCIAVADVNLTWKVMLGIISRELGHRRGILILPGWLTFIPALYGKHLRSREMARGLEGGLDLGRVFQDILSRFMYLDGAVSAAALGHGRGGVEQGIAETVRVCYPDRFGTNLQRIGVG